LPKPLDERFDRRPFESILAGDARMHLDVALLTLDSSLAGVPGASARVEVIGSGSA
jgi:hypothetical protein